MGRMGALSASLLAAESSATSPDLASCIQWAKELAAEFRTSIEIVQFDGSSSIEFAVMQAQGTKAKSLTEKSMNARAA